MFVLQLICSYLFRPFAFLMGVDWIDCPLVAQLLGTKTFLNEFIAYDRLGDYIKNRETGNCSVDYPCMSVSDKSIWKLMSFITASTIFK